MSQRELVTELANNFSVDNLKNFLMEANPRLTPIPEDLNHYLEPDDYFADFQQIGEVEFDDSAQLMAATIRSNKQLTERTSKRKQYDLAKKVLKSRWCDSGLFCFYDDHGNFRLSFVCTQYHGTRRTFSSFQRYTYFISPKIANKTFINQVGKCRFDSIENILEAFSIEAVSNEFYNEFQPRFDKIAESVTGVEEENIQLRQDFALLFTIRVIFLGFVQKKGWLGDNDNFIGDFWEEYRSRFYGDDEFYSRWLQPLFFQALNTPPGQKVAYGNNEFSEETELLLQSAPYLNGELFRRKRTVDDLDLSLPDSVIAEFIGWLFRYNFTIEENELYDEDLELNPEFLGIIFERLVNKADGAIYTPRVEVDLMCRLALLNWLDKNSSIDRRELYYQFFREAGEGSQNADDQKDGNFSANEIKEIFELIESLTVCDPAAGSGAFEVGMLHVLNEIIVSLISRERCPDEIKNDSKWNDSFERKKAIIGRSLYGVEVKRWAVWINQLRLWLTLFIDMPDKMRSSFEPLLPSLNFKVRRGDSLVQRIGNKLFPVQGHANLPERVKKKITELKKTKQDFYYNRGGSEELVRQQEFGVFRSVIEGQIDEKRKQLTAIESPAKQKRFAFHTQEERQTHLHELDKFKEDRKAIKEDIERLGEEIKALKEEHPLIWSIEFAEIFYDKGGFDIIIGNPPYVGKEDIADPNGIVDSKTYKENLRYAINQDFKGYFSSRKKIDGQSDLYTFFYVRSLKLLNDKGVHVFICSNSWLDVGYGTWMQEFLLNKVPVNLIIDNHTRRSFSNADVNTVITVMDGPCRKGSVSGDHVIKFVAFKKPFEQSIFTENLLEIEDEAEVYQNEIFRIYPIKTESLYDAGWDPQKQKYIGNKWGGKYLRAPDIFVNIVDNGELIRFGDNWDGQQFVSVMGYVHDNNTGEQFPVYPFLKTVKNIRKISIYKTDVGLQGVNDKGNSLVKAPILFPRTFGREHIVVYNPEGVVGKEFYRVFPNIVEPKSLVLYMNSTFFIMQRELIGLCNLGGGALKFSGDDIKLFLFPKKLEFSWDVKYLERFLDRPIQGLFVEIGVDPESDTPIEEQEPNPLSDRKELDDIVFDALGLTKDERKDVYRAVCRLVWNRISKAGSVKKRK